MTTDLQPRFAAMLDGRPGLIPPGARIVVAVSGGADSMALLHLLVGERNARRLEVVAAHFDHGQRASSAEEARQVERWCAELGVPFAAERWRAGSVSPTHLPTQAGLREARYAFLGRVCRDVGAARLATGHQADDQAETVLFRLLRGTGLRGLGGIPVRRGRIVRPLLPVPGLEIRGWLRARGLPWLEDPSNRDPRWMRTRIRWQLMPRLESMHGPGLRAELAALGEAACRAERTLDLLTDRLERVLTPEPREGEHDRRPMRLDRERVTHVHDEFLARILQRAAGRNGVRLTRGGTRAGVEFMRRGRSGAMISVGGGVLVRREYGVLTVDSGLAEGESTELRIPAPTRGEGSVVVGGRRVCAHWAPEGDLCSSRWRIAVPLGGGHYPLVLRGWRAGDRIRLAGGTRKLKRLFQDRRVPVGERRRVPLLADREGDVLWVAGLAVASSLEGGRAGEPQLVIDVRDD